MEEFIGLIIFGIIAAVSGLAKLQEQRKEEEARKQRANRKGVDELPEATRRMLYGDGGPPVARRRGEGPPPPPLAVPRAEAPRPAPQRRPVPPRQQSAPAGPPWQQPPQQPPPQRPAPQRQFAPEAPRPIAQPLPQRRDWRETPQMPPAQQQPDYRESSVVASEHAQERARSAEEVIRQEERYRSTDAPKQAAPKQPARMSQAQLFRSLARNKNALRASMITMEVMGPPKGLR